MKKSYTFTVILLLEIKKTDAIRDYVNNHYPDDNNLLTLVDNLENIEEI